MKKQIRIFVCLLGIVIIAMQFNGIVNASTPPIPGSYSKPNEFIIYLPWESGQEANMVAGSGYGEDSHINNNDYYAYDFNLTSEDHDDIYAVAPGTVIFSGYVNGYGNTVIIQHDTIGFSNYYSQYAHLESEPNVDHHDEVYLTTILGQEGDSGGDYSSHLHFSLRFCDSDIDNSDGGWPSNITDPDFCHPVVPEPFVGEHITEGLYYWNYMYENHLRSGSAATNLTAWRPSDYRTDTTLPVIEWGPDAPGDFTDVGIGDPLVYDMQFDTTDISEVRATIYYYDWAEYNLPGFDSELVWRILARCDPRVENSECEDGHWRFEWNTNEDFPVADRPGYLIVPWMPKAKSVNIGQSACISFDVFDQSGNPRYAPPGGPVCSFSNQIQDSNIRRITFVSANQSTDSAQFIADLTIPDGSIVSPGQSLTKTWRLKNNGMTTWGAGYNLVFVDGEQMGAPALTMIPAIAPNQTLDISIPLVAPTSDGTHTGYFRLRNPQGTYFGPRLSVKIDVRTASSTITTFVADPASPSDASFVRFESRVEGMPNFRAMRIKIDGEIKYEIGAPELVYDWQTSGYAAGAHNIVIEAADQTDTSWSHPEVRSMTYTLTGTGGGNNHVPEQPTLISPYNWYEYYTGNTAQLCAQAQGDPDGDAISGYYFEIYASAESWNSGWTASNCVTTAGLGPHNYRWHVKVSDEHGAESAWSEDWNFTLVNPALQISEFYFQPQDGDSEVVKIRACTTGQGGIGITMRVSVNDANDGSDSGEWHIIKEQGSPCFNDIDAPIWRTLEYGDGVHRVRVEAHGLQTGWDGAAVRDEYYTLPHRRPSDVALTAPIPASRNFEEAVYLNSRSVPFTWRPSLRASSYTLSVGLTSNPGGDPNPIFRQTFGAETTQYTVDFAEDYPVLYWHVSTNNDKGSNGSGSQSIGIDQTLPGCVIQPLNPEVYENNFQVIWAGTDNLSGIRTYDIQYQDSARGEWSDWLTAVPATKTYELFMGLPGHTYSFRCRATDRAANQGQYPDVGDTQTKIDPSARPPEPWWIPAYGYKRNITIQNNMSGMDLPAGYPVKVVFNAGTTPTAEEIYNASLSPNKCDDIRIVYSNTTEIHRVVKSCSPANIEIWFRTQSAVAAGGTSLLHQMYYGNPSPGSLLADPNQVWYPYWESGTTNLYYFQ